MLKERTDDLTAINESLRHEISRRKRAEDAMKRSEQQYRAILEQAGDSILLIDLDTNEFVKFNDMASKSLGYTRQEFKKLNLSDIATMSEDEIIKKNEEIILKGGATFTSKHRTKSGKLRDVHVFVKNVSLQGKQFGHAIWRDITEQKQAEKNYLKSIQILQSIFEGTLDPLLMLDQSLNIIGFNNAALEYYKIDQTRTLINKPCYLVLRGRFAPCKGCEVPSAILNFERRSFERKGLINPEKIERIDIYPINGIDTKAGTALIHVCDITEKKRLKEELIQADKMISLGILVSGVAHEINNPNNFIMLNVPIILEAWKNITPILENYYQKNGDFNMGGLPYTEMRDEIPGLFFGIEEGAKRIKSIVQSLKNYSCQDINARKQTLNINKVIDSAITLLKSMITKSTINFSTEYAKDLPALTGNFQKLEQVVINLIMNACQSLTDKKEGIFVISSFDKESGSVVIEVRDEGRGISDKALPHIMDPFYTTRQSHGGTGLGLFVSSNIIKKHDGKIKVKSQKGKGSTFKIILPAIIKEEPVKILLADDESSIIKLLTAALREKPNYLVQVASNGTEACIKLGSNRPDILVLDIMMPDMDGVEICRLIKEKPELVGVKVIVITGFSNSLELDKIIRMGFTTILPKPIRVPDFLKTIETVLISDQRTNH